MSDYDAACRKATTDQGLDPVIEALRAAGIPHELEQSGGYTMVVTVKVSEGMYAITNDGGFLLGHYPGDSLYGVDEGDVMYSYDVTLDEMVEKLTREL